MKKAYCLGWVSPCEIPSCCVRTIVRGHIRRQHGIDGHCCTGNNNFRNFGDKFKILVTGRVTNRIYFRLFGNMLLWSMYSLSRSHSNWFPWRFSFAQRVKSWSKCSCYRTTLKHVCQLTLVCHLNKTTNGIKET